MKPFTVIDCAQRSPEWYQERAGRLTGSNADKVTAKGRGSEESVQRRNLRVQLALERLTGIPADDGSGFQTADMRRGVELEPVAIAVYEAASGHFVSQTGFLRHDEYQAGCSLDGHLDDFLTLVSIKCPTSAVHLSYLKSTAMPAEYVPQMLHEMWITGAAAYEFVSFDPRFPEPLQLHRLYVPRDNAQVDAYAAKAKAFLAEVDNECETIRTLANLPGVLKAAS